MALSLLRVSTLCLIALLFSGPGSVSARNCEFSITRLHYSGGGDWYANPSSLFNLAKAVRERTAVALCDSIPSTTLHDPGLFHHPFLYMTGHGNVRFTPRERIRLRAFLIGGGFLWADDNYGMDSSFRREMAALFPENPLTPLPANHPIYSSYYTLPGLPKIHEHDGTPAQGWGIYFEQRLVVFYTYSSDIGDGMEDLQVHNDGEKLHELALKMGVNVVVWFLNQ